VKCPCGFGKTRFAKGAEKKMLQTNRNYYYRGKTEKIKNLTKKKTFQSGKNKKNMIVPSRGLVTDADHLSITI
jgi:hypothetical protein